MSARSAPVLLQVRPRRIVIFASIAAFLVVAMSVTVGVLLTGTSAGVQFRTADQVGIIGVGVLLAAVIMTAARPRLRVDENGSRPHAEVEVLDDGRPRGRSSGSGLGHLGVRERAASQRGEAEIGPRPTGGYRVRVRIPLGQSGMRGSDV